MWVLVSGYKDGNVDVIVKNADAAIDCLNRLHGLIEVLLIDYVLADDMPTYDVGIHKYKPKATGKRVYGKPKKADGYDILMYAIVNNLLPPVVQVCANTVNEFKQLEKALEHDAKYIKKGVNWIKLEKDEGDQNDDNELIG